MPAKKPARTKKTAAISNDNRQIKVRGARVHNLKNVSIDIPKEQLVVITGLSGSGKSSLAFDTIYAEGQRRYMESLSSYATRFLEIQDKPDVDSIEGLSPTIAIDQKSASYNPRSTVGTVTDLYDLLRLLFARAGVSHCPDCGKEVKEHSVEEITKTIIEKAGSSSLDLYAPVIQQQKGEHKHMLVTTKEAGYDRVRYDGLEMDTEEAIRMRKNKKNAHDIDVLITTIAEGQADKGIVEALIKKALDLGNGFIIIVEETTGEEFLFSQKFTCADCQVHVPRPEPRLFSFNSPLGACEECMGLGVKLVLEPELIIPNKRLTFAEGAIKPWVRIFGTQSNYMKLLEAVAKKQKFSVHTAVEKVTKTALNKVLYGTGETTYKIDGKDVVFPGILAQLEEKYRETDSDYIRKELESYMRKMTCPACEGKRLKPEVLAIKIDKTSIADVVHTPLGELKDFFESLNQDALKEEQKLVVERVQKEALSRVEHLLNVGLGYLTLDRPAMTLSGGEGQRARLATQLGSQLSGVIYILDEPSIGLHSRDNDALIETIKVLRDQGNTVIVVEHDETMMEAADYIVDVGPGAGHHGGEIIAEGTLADIKKDKDSLTGKYLSKKKKILPPKKPHKGSGKHLVVQGANAFNLQNIDVKIPLGKLVCVTGVSGSGKSTLVLNILAKALSKHFYRAKAYPGEHKGIKGLEHIDKVVAVDQSPIGRTPRSNPATYTGVFTAIRDVFAGTQEANMRGYDAGKFSFNVKGGGRCEACSGEGKRHIEMQFLPDVYVDCQECDGTRYNHEALEIHYRGKNISDILNMTVEEARRFFKHEPAIYDKLSTLYDVGLGYMQLGQPATTLSGGEAQRVKLATELSRRATGKTLYILDEPTTGLHFEDIDKLLHVLEQLVDKGNTVLIIEHNLDVIKTADWIIDMGPDGGVKGGEVVAEGTPKQIVKMKDSLTGKYLKGVVE